MKIDQLRREKLKGHLELLLLAVLQRGPAHGYALITTLAERSDGRFELPEGTIYPALHRLEDASLVRSTWDETGARRRRVYEITGPGVRALQSQRQEWREFAAGIDSVLRSAAGWSA